VVVGECSDTQLRGIKKALISQASFCQDTYGTDKENWSCMNMADASE